MEDITQLISSVATLIGALSWPLVVIFLAFLFGKPVKEYIISHMEEFTIKAGPTGLEVSAKIQELKDNLPIVGVLPPQLGPPIMLIPPTEIVFG